MDIGLTDPWITLTIKAPNQQINDHIIKCKLDWSVAKLKVYIHETYPNKPKAEDQRIIYSGQLLTDSVILKDILRPYDKDGQLNRTVHLVCASSSFCIPPKEKLNNEQNINETHNKIPNLNEINYGASTSGFNSSLKSNQEASASNNQKNTKTSQNQAQSTTNNHVNHIPLSPEQIAKEQILWLNKMYVFQMVGYLGSAVKNLKATTMITEDIESPEDVPPNNNNNDNNPPVDQNNVPGNNGNRNVRDANGHHPDWLDWLYVSSRVFIFISVLYFYSSPGRFIVVAGFALLFYLYQNGILRHINEHNRRRFQPQPQEQHTDDNRNLPEEQNGNTNDAAVRQNEHLITTIWTVISTFFTSLVPQQPDII